MGGLTQKETKECSAETLKMVYYVIIGLAFAEALTAFTKGASWILLLALLATICRFVHGASIHLKMDMKDLTKRWKLLWDFIGFFLQASFFYLMAHSLDTPVIFSKYFIIMLSCDAGWLIFLMGIKYIEKLERTEKQWLWSDVILIVILIMFNIIKPIGHIEIISISAIAATIFDYVCNRNFYFPNSEVCPSTNKEV